MSASDVAGAAGDGPPDGRPQNPAAERNKEPIRAVLERVLPPHGEVLEIASGSGTHVLHFARNLPGLHWQPTEADETLREAIAERLRAGGAGNVHAPLALDVRRRPWPIERADALVCINMTHVAPWDATEALLDGAGAILPVGGPVMLYGPFRRFGRHTAASNEAFDAALRGRDPRWGLRDVEAVTAAAEAWGFALAEIVDMPANNHCLVFRRGGDGRASRRSAATGA